MRVCIVLILSVYLMNKDVYIKPNYASVRQSRDSLHRDRHKVTKKVAAAPCSETA